MRWEAENWSQYRSSNEVSYVESFILCVNAFFRRANLSSIVLVFDMLTVSTLNHQ